MPDAALTSTGLDERAVATGRTLAGKAECARVTICSFFLKTRFPLLSNTKLQPLNSKIYKHYFYLLSLISRVLVDPAATVRDFNCTPEDIFFS